MLRMGRILSSTVWYHFHLSFLFSRHWISLFQSPKKCTGDLVTLTNSFVRTRECSFIWGPPGLHAEMLGGPWLDAGDWNRVGHIQVKHLSPLLSLFSFDKHNLQAYFSWSGAVSSLKGRPFWPASQPWYSSGWVPSQNKYSIYLVLFAYEIGIIEVESSSLVFVTAHTFKDISWEIYKCLPRDITVQVPSRWWSLRWGHHPMEEWCWLGAWQRLKIQQEEANFSWTDFLSFELLASVFLGGSGPVSKNRNILWLWGSQNSICVRQDLGGRGKHSLHITLGESFALPSKPDFHAPSIFLTGVNFENLGLFPKDNWIMEF